MRPAFSRTRKCFEIAGNDIACGLARCVTQRPPCARWARIRRRVGSANAANVRFNIIDECLTIWLSISSTNQQMQTKF